MPVGHTYLHHILYPKKNSIITSTGSSINSAVIYVYFIKSTACELIIDGGEIRYIKGIPAIPTIIRPIINTASLDILAFLLISGLYFGFNGNVFRYVL